MSEAPPERPVPVDVPGYRLERVLDRGGFGTVFCAVDEEGRRVALKVAPTGDMVAAGQLSREVTVLRAVGPVFAPDVLGTGKLSDGSPYVSLELLDGQTLSERLRVIGGPMDHSEFVATASALCDAVDGVHRAGYLHLDLKPQNIFLTPSGVRLIDFGISRRIGELSPRKSGFAGTAAYASPEQCEEQLDLDLRADVYAIGILLFEMLTGRTPFAGTEQEIRDAQVARRPPRPSQLAPVAPALEAVVLRAIAKQRTQRYGDCSELRGAVAAASTNSIATEATRTLVPAEARLQRRPVGMLFFATDVDPGSVRDAARSVGGELAWIGRRRYAVLFGSAAGQDPVRRALRAADGLAARKFAVRAIVDVGVVNAHLRTDGELRYLAPELGREDHYPRESDPLGILATPEAVQVLAEIEWEAVPARGLFAPRARATGSFQAATVVQLGAGALVGRDGIVREVIQAAESALQGVPTIATVIGDPGHGKTHLAAAIVDNLRSRAPGAEVLEIRAREPLAGDSDELLRTVLSRALELSSTDGESSARSRFAAAVGAELCNELWPATALMLRLTPADVTRVRALGAAPGVLRAMAMRAAGEALRSRAARNPLCVLLDDGQFADDVTLDALEFAALAEGKARLLVCVFARPAFAESRKSFGERAARQQVYQLGVLEPGPATELCRRLLVPAEHVPKRAIDLLVQRSQGVPLLLVELIRGLKRDGLIRKRLRGESWFVATDELEQLPKLPLIEWLAERELSALPAELASHARLSSLLGVEFTVDELDGVVTQLDSEGLAEEFPLDARVASSRLAALGVLVTTRSGGFRFRHALVRDAVAKSVMRAEAQRIHAAAARFYRETEAVPYVRRLPLLARHSAEAGLKDEAAKLYLQLAEEARGRHSYFDAEQSYTTALKLIGNDDVQRRLMGYRGRGSMRYRIGRYEDAFADFEAARELAQSAADRAAECDIVLDAATALDWVMDYDRSGALVVEAESLSAGVTSAGVHARLVLGKGRTLYRTHEWEAARNTLQEATRLAEQLGDDAYETLIISLVILEVVLGELKYIDEAEQVASRAIALAQEHGDQLHFAAALINRRLVRIARHDAAGAIHDLHALTRIGRELGIVLLEYIAATNLCELLYQIDDLSSAAAQAQRAIAIEERHPDVAGRGPVGLLALARIEAYRGQIVLARDLLRRIDETQQAGIRGNSLGPLTPPDELLKSMVDLCTREATTTEWETLLSRSERDCVEQDSIEVAEFYGVWALRRGRLDEARRAYEEAARRAARVPNIMGARIEKGLAATGGLPT